MNALTISSNQIPDRIGCTLAFIDATKSEREKKENEEYEKVRIRNAQAFDDMQRNMQLGAMPLIIF